MSGLIGPANLSQALLSSAAPIWPFRIIVTRVTRYSVWPKSFSKETKVGHIATSKAAEAEIMTVEQGSARNGL